MDLRRSQVWVSKFWVSRLALAVLAAGLLVVVLMPASQPAVAAAGTNKYLSYQGRLLTNTGAVVADGNYNMKFRIYCDGDGVLGGGSDPGSCSGSATAEHLLWTETRQNSASQGVVVKNGYFSVNLGDVTSLSTVDWYQDKLWLSMDVTTNGTDTGGSPTYNGEMSPFRRVTSTAYAINALQNVAPGSTQQTANLNILSGAGTGVAAAQIQTVASATAPVLILKGGATPTSTADLLQLQSSSATLARIDYQGNLYVASAIDTQTATPLVVGNSMATQINLNQNVVVAASKSLTITGSGSRPGSPTEGMLYYDTTAKQLLVYANGKWQADRHEATEIVAMGTATGCSGTSPVASGNADAADFVSTSCTSAQTAINNAISALPANGGVVYLMEGTYIIDGTITVPSNVTIAGAGASTLLKLKDSVANSTYILSSTSTSRITIQNLRLDGNKANNGSGTSQRGIYLDSVGSSSTAPGARITNVIAENFRTEGIRVANTSYNTTISNSYAGSNTGDGIYIAGNNISITGSTVVSNGANGVQALNCNYCSITGSSAISNTSVGFFAWSVTDMAISGNIAKSNTGPGIMLNTATRSTVNSNTSSSNSQEGIRLYSSSNNTVSDNKLYDNGTTLAYSSIELNGSAPSGNTITGNDITDTAGTAYAIDIDNTAPGVKNYLSNNRFSGTGASSISDGGTETIYGNQLNGNGDSVLRSTNGVAVGLTSATSSLSVQGSYVGTQLPAPAAPTVTRTGATGGATYTYAVTATDGLGETLASSTTSLGSSANPLTGANYLTISWVRVGGAVSYKVYRTAVTSGSPNTTGLIGTVSASSTTMSLNDTGLAASGSTPSANTTGGMSLAGALQGTSETLTPTANGVVALTVNATSGTAAQALVVNSAAAFAGATEEINHTNTSGIITNGLLVNRNGASGTTTNGINITQTAGTLTNGLSFTGTIGTDIYRSSGTLTVQGAGGVSVNSSGGNVTVGGAVTSVQNAAGSETYLTATASSNQVKIGNSTASAGTDTTIFVVDSAATTNQPTGVNGGMYYDTTTNQIMTYENGHWQSDTAGGTTVTVAASNSYRPEKADYQVTSALETAGNADSIIQTAVTAVSGAGGGTVQLMEGTYTVDGTISIPSNVTLAGSGDATIIKIKASLNTTFDVLANTNSGGTGDTNIVIRDLKLDGTKATNATGANNGISLTKVAPSATGVGAKISRVTAQNFNQYGVLITNSYNTSVSNSILASNDYGGVDAEGSSALSITGNNTLNNGFMFYGDIRLGASTTYSTISGNTSNGSLNLGISIDTSNYNTVTGNSVYNSSGSGISLTSANSNNVTGNTVVNAAFTGINLNVGSNTNTISSNRIDNSGGSGSNSGIKLTATDDNNVINDNNITDTAGTGYAIDITASTDDNNILSNNRFSGTGATTINDAGTGTIYNGQFTSANAASNTFRAPNSTTAIQIQNTSATTLLGVDTSGSRISMGAYNTGGIDVNTNLNTPFGGLGNIGNMINDSELFNASAWTKSNVTVTANDATSNPAPNGTTTADKLVSTLANATVSQDTNFTLPLSNSYTFSVWLKTNSGTQPVSLQINGTSSGTGTANNVTATTSWQRFSVTQSVTGFTGNIKPVITITNNSATVVAWGAQMTLGTDMGVYRHTGDGISSKSNEVSNTTTGAGWTGASVDGELRVFGSIVMNAEDESGNLASIYSSTGELAMYVGQNDRAVMTQSGNFGIGFQMNVATANTGGKLSVRSGDDTPGDTGLNIFQLTDTTSGGVGTINVMTVADEGATTFRNRTNSASAFLIQKADATNLLKADTSTMAIGVNNVTPSATFTVKADAGTATTTAKTTAGSSSVVIPNDVTSITVTAWGAGGGGAAGNSTGLGGSGGGGGFAKSTIAVTPGETLTVVVGTGGVKAAANEGGAGVNGGDGGGMSYVQRSSTYLITAPGGGGGGGTIGTGAGGQGAGGGGSGSGGTGGNGTGNTDGGGGATTSAGGTAGGAGATGAAGVAGTSLAGGNGASGSATVCTTAGSGTGGATGFGGAGKGGIFANNAACADGGGGGGGTFGGGGGGSTATNNDGAGGGGGGSGIVTGSSTTQTAGGNGTSGTGGTTANGDSTYSSCASSAGVGGAGATTAASAVAGKVGCVIITYTTSANHATVLNTQNSSGTDTFKVQANGITSVTTSAGTVTFGDSTAGTNTAVKITTGWDIGVAISSGGIQMSGMTDPTAPTSTATDTAASGDARVYAQSIAGKMFLKVLGSGDTNYALQPSLFSRKICFSSNDLNNGEQHGICNTAIIHPNTSGNDFNCGGDAGCASTVSQTFGSYLLMKNLTAANTGVTTSAPQTASIGQNWLYRGSTTGANGYFYVARVAFPDASYTNIRYFAGLTDDTTLKPAELTSDDTGDNRSGFSYSVCSSGCRTTTASTFRFTTRDGAGGSQTLTDTTVSLTAQHQYVFYIYCPPQGSSIYWRIDDINPTTNAVTTTTNSQTTHLPTGSAAMTPLVTLTNPINATVNSMGYQSLYVETAR